MMIHNRHIAWNLHTINIMLILNINFRGKPSVSVIDNRSIRYYPNKAGWFDPVSERIDLPLSHP